MSYDDTRFEVMFTRYGGWTRLLKSWDFILASVGSVVGTVLVGYRDWELSFVPATFVAFVTVAAAMVATSLAGLAIIASISDPNYVAFAKRVPIGKTTVYDNIIFVFWFAALISFISLIADLSSALAVALSSSESMALACSWIMLFFLLYSVFAVMFLLGTITRWGFFRGLYILGQTKPD